LREKKTPGRRKRSGIFFVLIYFLSRAAAAKISRRTVKEAGMTSERGFTLVEILIALAIGGIIITAGVAPLLFTVRTLSRSRDDFSRMNAERTAVNRIFLDAREMNALNRAAPFRVFKSQNIAADGGGYLSVRSSSPSNYGRPAGCIVWGAYSESAAGRNLADEAKPGLYRWVLPDDLTAASADASFLSPAAGTLALPGVTSVSFFVLDGSEWKDSYEGSSPRGLRVSLRYEDGEAVYEEMLPRF
jgi:prepilin-type N-terminal cleavage/methylation domain-containing protein